MCDRPLRGFKIGYTKNGKPDYLICSSNVDFVFLDSNGKWNKMHGDIPKTLKNDYIKEFQPIPCGCCLSCRLTRAAEMADRCMLEMKNHDKACFITLTYDDEHIIRTRYVNKETGETGISETLFKKHYQDFIKRLRKHYPDNNIRYVLCGEYGDTTFRPHYHAIIFGYEPADKQYYSINKRGQILYNSMELQKLWNKGFVVVGDVTKDSANYVCRYVTKKLYSDLGQELYQDKGRIPPFIVSSKRPAIGKTWYENNKEWCFDHQISYSTPDGGHSFQAPRYFKKLREKDLSLYKNLKYNKIEDLKNHVGYLEEVDYKNRSNASKESVSQIKERRSKSKAAVFNRDSI